MPEPHLRAADTDRAAVATVLGGHMAAGRLTVDEYDERLTRAYRSKTYGELAQLTADLPATTTGDLARTPAAVDRNRSSDRDPHSWRSWGTTALIVLAIWAATSLTSWEFLYFWPIWVLGPWGVVLLAQSFGGDEEDDEGRRLER